MKLSTDTGNGTPLGYALVGLCMLIAAIVLGGQS